jgi:hypothetical protein
VSSIHFSFDLATSISVVFAVLVFGYSRMAENIRLRTNVRLSHIEKLCEEMSEIIIQGHEVISRIDKKIKRETNPINPCEISDEITSFCLKVYSFIKVKQKCTFTAWATIGEKKILSKMEGDLLTWYKMFEAANNDKKTPMPELSDLLNQLTDGVVSLSNEISAEVMGRNANLHGTWVRRFCGKKSNVNRRDN